MPQTSSLNDVTREVRLGIVLYGGVSLAVYENGVAQELFRVVKGAGIYTVIKQLTGCDVVLDIISGTSAGGINGILLGYALANDCDPSVTGDFWREEGDILNLLHAPGDPAPNSILNSRGYYQPRLEQAYAAIKSQAYQPHPGDLVSPIAELDVFITGTNVYGHVYTEFDDFGHAIDVKDHRALFHLRKRIENDFTHGSEVYAKLSRITSCFPVAFEPVEVNGTTGEPGDLVLIEWGNLAREFDQAGGEISSFFLDGGILDNKPFSSTLGAIFHHTQTREVERYLLYVEPDPERFRKDRRDLHRSAPNVLQAAGDGLSSIPGYQSIAADLGAIAEHNSRVQRYRELADRLIDVSDELMSRLTFLVPAELSDMDDQPAKTTNPAEHKTKEEQAAIYRRSRISQVRDRVVDGVLKQKGQRRLLDDRERQAGERLVTAFNQLDWAVTLESLHQFDIYYRLRRLFFVADLISGIVNGGGANLGDNAREAYREAWRHINRRIKRLEIIQSKMEQLIDLADFRWQKIMMDNSDPAAGAGKIWAGVQGLLQRLLDPAELPRDAVAAEDEFAQGKLYEALDKRVHELVESFDPDSAGPRSSAGLPDNLLLRGDADEFALLKQRTPGQLGDLVTQHYCRFVFVDSYLFPMQYMSEMECTDKVRTVRISPVDARLGFSGDPRKRLCGDELWHFGGFLKSSWRANDLMWGRLDGACQLIQCVVTPERLRKLSPAEQKLVLALLRARCPAGVEYTADLEKELENFANAAHGSAQEKGAFDNFLSALIYVGQSEILQQEVPRVVEASIAQQGVWNQYDLNNLLSQQANLEASESPQAPDWRAGARQPDRTVTSYAAVRFAEDSSRDWVRYFREEYTVAGEQWQNGIPRSVLIEIITTMILVLRKSLLAIGGNGAAVRGSMILRLTSFPLRIAYYLTRIQRLAPEYLRVAVFGGFVFCFSVLGVYAYTWWRLGAKASLPLLVVPVIILAVLAAVVYLMYRRYRPSGQKRENVSKFRKGSPQVSP